MQVVGYTYVRHAHLVAMNYRESTVCACSGFSIENFASKFKAQNVNVICDHGSKTEKKVFFGSIFMPTTDKIN